jgi:homogentisate 1,2-dioxygenase
MTLLLLQQMVKLLLVKTQTRVQIMVELGVLVVQELEILFIQANIN